MEGVGDDGMTTSEEVKGDDVMGEGNKVTV